jgi:hypothetical protein
MPRVSNGQAVVHFAGSALPKNNRNIFLTVLDPNPNVELKISFAPPLALA